MFGPVSGTIVLLLVWEAVAHASGSGWVQGLAAVAAGVAVAGMIGPGVVARRITVEVLSSPRDAVAGSPFTVQVSSNRPCRCTPVRPSGPPLVLDGRRPAELRLLPHHRGVLGVVTVRVATAAPLGLLWWSARHDLELPVPVLIAPQREAGATLTAEGTDDEHEASAAVLADHGELRGVREYRVGDSPRQVHWRASAHTGALMVREAERLVAPTVTVSAQLSDDIEVAEREASRALETVVDLIERGHRVVLETTEPSGRLSAPVASELSAGRRLARAGVNPWADGQTAR